MIDSLRRRLAAAEGAASQQGERAEALAQSLAHQQRELDAMRTQLHLESDKDGSRELFLKAMQYDYYWYNADKKIDLRDIGQFGEIAARVRQKNRTFLYFDRLYTLWQGVTAMPARATGAVEIGAYRGGSARFIAEAMRATGRELPLSVCDTFHGHVEVDETIDGEHVVAKQFTKTDVESVRHHLRRFPNVRVMEGDIRTTSADIEEHELGLVHIDVDVYPITKYCLEFFVPKVVPGGTIVVDDYGPLTCPGAKKAVDEYAAANPRVRMLHLLTGQAVLIVLRD